MQAYHLACLTTSASKLDLSGGVKTVHVLEINELLVGVAKRDKTEINR